MTEFLQQLINGLSLGSIYALIALGYTMVYGVLRFINFAHSDVFMVGAFAGFYLAKYLPQESIASGLAVLAASMLICAALGIIIERFAYRPLRGGSNLNVLITAIGVSLLLENAGQLIFKPDPKPFPTLFPMRNFNLGGLVLSSNQLTVFLVTIVLLVGLQFIVQRTRIGTAMRALSFNRTAASLVGINNDIVISFTFGLGSALAAAGGILYSMNYPAIDPLMGILPGLKAFVAAVLGGIGNIPGAALGGLLLGIIETFVNASPWSTYTDAIAFTLLILILLFRPAGLLGKMQVGKSLTMPARSQLILLAAIIASFVVSVFSNHINEYYLQVAITVGINIILAVSLNLVNGYTGQFSLGHAGFMSVGAYTSAAITLFLGPKFLASAGSGVFGVSVLFLGALIGGGLLAAVAGFIVGAPSLRLKGDYLAIVTLGFGEIIRVIIRNITPLGGSLGLNGIPPYTNFFWTFAFVALTTYAVVSMVHSTYGRGFLAVHDDEVAAEAMGLNTTRYKIIAFVVGAFFAGIAGGIYAHLVSSIDPKGFDFIKSIEIVVMVILGGMGNTPGVILAAILLTLLPEFLRPIAEYRMLIYSLLLIVLMLTRPQGLFTWRRKIQVGGHASLS